MKKIFVTAFVGGVANCLAGHVVDWCLFETLRMRCPRQAG